MQGNRHHLIAREGWPILAFIVLLAFVSHVYIGPIPFIIFLLLLGPALVIFRNPAATIPSAPLAVVSPASGKLLAIDTVEDTWLERKAIRFRLRLSLWDVHALRSPVEGKVMDEWSAVTNGSGQSRRYTYWIRTDEGDDVVFSLLLNRWSPFVRIFMRSGERIGQGQPCGYLYYSGMIEVFMPENAGIESQAGAQLESGSDILGQFVHNNGESAIGK
ncbi:MAG: phosphatidylserine decarboxylase [Gammaproteobacteria bacterium]